MEPPTRSLVVKVVRTTGVVASWPLPPCADAALPLPPLTAAATPPATTPPTRAPATLATTRTCWVKNSAIAARPRCARFRDVSGARIYLLEEAGRGRGIGGHSGL